MELGRGSGRNRAALEASGHRVIDLGGSCAERSHCAALTTHALLHGSEAEIANLCERLAEVLEAGGSLFATFGSTDDARYGLGIAHGAHSFAASEGDEIGVTHTFFDEPRLRALLEGNFEIESLRRCPVDDVVGAWAHQGEPLRGGVHWFVIARRR